MRNADSISVPSFALNYASIAVDTDIVAAANTRLAAIGRQPVPCARRICVGVGGNVVVTLQGDPATSITYYNVPTGGSITGAYLSIIASGTTATYLTVEY